jgi:hypothetical protein
VGRARNTFDTARVAHDVHAFLEHVGQEQRHGNRARRRHGTVSTVGENATARADRDIRQRVDGRERDRPDESVAARRVATRGSSAAAIGGGHQTPLAGDVTDLGANRRPDRRRTRTRPAAFSTPPATMQLRRATSGSK